MPVQPPAAPWRPVVHAGSLWEVHRTTLTSANLTAGADLTPAPAAGSRLILDDLWVSADRAVRLDVWEVGGPAPVLLWQVYLPPPGGSEPWTPRDGLPLAPGARARAQADRAASVCVVCLYHEA
jgi:hypothetical protein